MQDIRNIAVIAHVDHGKTTLVDKMMIAGNLFRDGQKIYKVILKFDLVWLHFIVI